MLKAELGALNTRRFLAYRESVEWAREAGAVVDEIAAEAATAPSRELLSIVEQAVGRVVRVILKADDSSGMIGDLAGQLLEMHLQLCNTGVADPKALTKWMVRFAFDDQDFFTLDRCRTHRRSVTKGSRCSAAPSTSGRRSSNRRSP